jgi:hypothetical protein
VRLGFEKASGDILMILDADLTVAPRDLPRFFDAISSGKGEFINGVRLVYPMEDEAMRFFNLVGNKFFSFAFSWLLGQPIKDTLCGTKVLWKRDYMKIVQNRPYFGDLSRVVRQADQVFAAHSGRRPRIRIRGGVLPAVVSASHYLRDLCL